MLGNPSKKDLQGLVSGNMIENFPFALSDVTNTKVNATPRVAAKFYKAVVQSVLLFGSETWNLTRAVLAQLEGFHVRAVYKLARKYKPRKGLFGKWNYPLTKDVLEECGLHSVEEYIQTRWTMIAMYVVNHPLYLECK